MFKLDTEAQCNKIPIATFNKIKNKPKSLKTETKLKAYGGHNIDIVAKCNMVLSLPKKNLTCEFFIFNTKYNVHHITIKPETDGLIKKLCRCI